MSSLTSEQQSPSRRRSAAILAATALAATTLILYSSSPNKTTDINQTHRRLWAQNIYWAGNPNDVPPPPAPRPPPKQSQNHYRPPPSAPKAPLAKAPPGNAQKFGNPFEKYGSVDEANSKSKPSGVVQSKLPPPPPPPPSPPAVSVSQSQSSPSSAITSNSYYSRGQSNPAPTTTQNTVAEQQQTASQAFTQEPPQQIQQREPAPEPVAVPVVQPPKQTAQAFTAEPPPQKQQAATPIQSVPITSSISIGGIPSTIPPAGSMERMALLNLLVNRIDAQISSISNYKVKDITILAIGDTNMLTRKLRKSTAGDATSTTASVDSNVDRSLWSTTQVVKFTALLEYLCNDESEQECTENAQGEANGLAHQLSATAPSTSPISNTVDNEGEDWSNPSSSFVWIPNPSLDSVQVVTSSPTHRPSPLPTVMPTPSPTLRPTPHPTLFPTRSPMELLTFNFEVELSAVSNPPPTNKPSGKPTLSSAVTQNEWFNEAGLFQGDASKRFCGVDWMDVVANCLVATPCPQGHAEGVCPYGTTCIADTPCAEVRAHEEELARHQAEIQQVQPATTSTTSSTTTTTMTSTAAATTTTTTTITTESVEQRQQSMNMNAMQSNTNPSPNTAASCTYHGDCTNQLCGTPNSGFEGMCVDCLFNSHIGCRASEVCILSLDTNMPVCQENPSAATTTTTTTTSTTTTQSQNQPQPQQSQYQNPSNNQYFCGPTLQNIISTCLTSKPCPSGIAAIECGHQEGCFASADCQSQYAAAGAVVEPSGTSMSAFAAFDSSIMGEEDENGVRMDDESFWMTTWRNGGYASSCRLSLISGFVVGVAFVLF